MFFTKKKFISGIKDQPMFFLFPQKEPIRPADLRCGYLSGSVITPVWHKSERQITDRL
jgi:hypothetical protein